MIIGAFLGGLSGFIFPILLFYFLILTGSDESVGQVISFFPLFMIPLGIILGALFGPALPKIISIIKTPKEVQKDLSQEQFEKAWQNNKKKKS